jgi:hypothetical protein
MRPLLAESSRSETSDSSLLSVRFTPKAAAGVEWREAALPCDFNRSLQHLSSHYREEDVENEAAIENLLHRNG